MRAHRFAAQYGNGATETLEDRKLLSPAERPSYDDLKAKHGDNWGITQETKPPPFASLEQLRERYGSKIDDVPDAPLKDWKQPKAPPHIAADIEKRKIAREALE